MKIFLFSILLLFTINGFALNWKKFYENPMGESYVDIDNISKRNNIVYYSRLFDYLKPSPIGVRSSISKFSVDCISEKITWISSVYYNQQMGKGDVVKEGTFNKRLYPRTDTVDYVTMKFVCNFNQLNT
tara:strand:+ start:162 stop:548 length:387 start_codon:yes stop_codon:yes gene_type:complete